MELAKANKCEKLKKRYWYGDMEQIAIDCSFRVEVDRNSLSTFIQFDLVANTKTRPVILPSSLYLGLIGRKVHCTVNKQVHLPTLSVMKPKQPMDVKLD